MHIGVKVTVEVVMTTLVIVDVPKAKRNPVSYEFTFLLSKVPSSEDSICSVFRILFPLRKVSKVAAFVGSILYGQKNQVNHRHSDGL